jgi:membrane-associated phospholipid phosphatase
VQSQPAQPAVDATDTSRRRIPLLIAAGLYVVVTGVLVAVNGKLLISRDVVFIWLMGGLLILSLNNPRRWVRGLVVDWLPFILFLFAYDYVRSVADETGFTPHLAPQIKADRLMFGLPLPNVELQSQFYHPAALSWYDYVTWVTYITHFFGTLTLAVILWRFAYPLFRKWRTLVMWLSAAGFATYVLYPAVPPWLASDTGKIGKVTKIKDAMFAHTGTKSITSAVEKNWVDKVAAMPSLHAAFPMMMTMLFWHKGWRWRVPFLAYTFLMGYSLVYLGEHWVIDIFVGWAYAIGIYLALAWYWRRRQARRAERAEPEPAPAQAGQAAPAVSYSGAPGSAPERG